MVIFMGSNLKNVKSSYASQQRKKRQKIASEEKPAPSHRLNCMEARTRRCRTETDQKIYTSKLLLALQRSRRQSPASTTFHMGGREVQETANRVLAVAAKGRTRWSRAILASQRRFKLKKHKRSKKVSKCSHSQRMGNRYKKKKLPSVKRKVEVLSRLVPGCRKLSLPKLLEEAKDYIGALEMQIRAMTALTRLLSPHQRAN